MVWVLVEVDHEERNYKATQEQEDGLLLPQKSLTVVCDAAIIKALKDISQMLLISEELEPVIYCLGLTILSDQRRVLREDQEITLNRLEYQLLLKLAQHPKRIFTREQLCQELYGQDSFDYDNALNCLVSSLRKKIEYDSTRPRYIKTVRGVGYRFHAPDE